MVSAGRQKSANLCGDPARKTSGLCKGDRAGLSLAADSLFDRLTIVRRRLRQPATGAKFMPVGVYHLDMALTGAAPEPSNRPKSPLAVLLPYTTVGVLLAALYVAWTFYSRHESTRKAEEAAQMEKERARKRVVDQVYGSGEVRFSIFSAGSAAVRRGERTQLCYGVVNANTVKIEPSVGEELK